MTCYKPDSESVIDSFRTSGPPTTPQNQRGAVLARNLSSGIRVLSLHYIDNKLSCSYRMMLSASGDFMADLTTHKFAIWAYGNGNGGPSRHSRDERGASASAINLRFPVILITVVTNFRIHLKASHKVLVRLFL